jgi:intracellular sulfur oxidation DsrE/DsrF family protein
MMEQRHEGRESAMNGWSILSSPRLLFAAALIVMAPGARAAPWEYPLIQDYGAVRPLPHAAEQPDTAVPYRVVFDIRGAASAPDQVNPGLNYVARFVNLLALAGVPAGRARLVAMVHGRATESALGNAAYRAKHGRDNPNLELIQRLRESGAEVHVCGQALAEQEIAATAVDLQVQIDLAGFMTLANLQLRGYALIPD